MNNYTTGLHYFACPVLSVDSNIPCICMELQVFMQVLMVVAHIINSYNECSIELNVNFWNIVAELHG